jgi:hypothetical protein
VLWPLHEVVAFGNIFSFPQVPSDK